MKCLKVAVLGTLFVFGEAAQAYDVVQRFKIIDDKLKTEAMLRPLGHDFFLDVGAALNKNIKDVIDDVDKASKFQGSDTAKINEANRILAKYDKTEQTVKVNVGVGAPLPSFTAWDVKFAPNFRILFDLGANIGIRNKALTNQDILNLFKDQVPQELQSVILGLDLVGSAGQDIRTICLARVTPGSIAEAYCTSLPVGKYVIPNVGTQDPTMSLLAKADAKVGFFNDYTSGEHFFGNFNLYGMGRADFYQFVTGTQIAKGDSIEAPKKMNTETTVQADYRIGYKNSNYATFLGVEELKLFTLKDPQAGSKAQTYGYNALIRLHADATYKWSGLSFQPFLGFHKRSGYGLGDGMYAGAAAGAHVWGDRLGLQLRGMFDKQYFTLTPRLKLWLMQLEYSLKKPLKSTDGDVKLTALHSIDFRIFF